LSTDDGCPSKIGGKGRGFFWKFQIAAQKKLMGCAIPVKFLNFASARYQIEYLCFIRF
jgi:hypothetical protein